MESSHEITTAIWTATSTSLNYEISKARTRLNSLEQALSFFTRDPRGLVFQVRLDSLWEGEKPVTTRSGKGLQTAITRAQKKFKAINSRSDVQARYSARIFFTRDIRTKSAFSIAVDPLLLQRLTVS